MTTNILKAISPIDGRYSHISQELSNYFSEYALMSFRVLVEVKWLQYLSNLSAFTALPKLNYELNEYLDQIINNFDLNECEKIKNIEKTTKHDVKAVEYYLKEKLSQHKELDEHIELVHFGLTSEDVNNVAYSLMLKTAIEENTFKKLDSLQGNIIAFALMCKDLPMLSRTHGQAASPTTLGKEFANVAARIAKQLGKLRNQTYFAKLNGAVGNYNALKICMPEIDWDTTTSDFIQELGLKQQEFTTQIEPHDFIAEICHNMIRINTILIDFTSDVWCYISLDYLRQKLKEDEVGSSTMPHKVNPIDFENAEGNLRLANALNNFFANKLPISRFQRDLSDSTVLRNLGVSFAYQIIALESINKGLGKLVVNTDELQSDLNQHPAVLAEAIQMMMRLHKIEKPYEKLKELTRGSNITMEDIQKFVKGLDLPAESKKILLKLKPQDYIGLASSLVSKYFE